MSNGTDVLTPVGRLVQGSPWEGQTKDAEGRPLVVKTGPNAGQPRVDYFMAIAIPKNAPEWPALYAQIVQAAREGFPRLFDAAGNCVAQDFAWKITDGDSQVPNTRGVTPASRPGFPGCWVLNFSSGFAPKCCSAGGAEILMDPQSIKRGYYIRIAGTVTGNGSQQQPGVYLNHRAVELVGYGEEIATGVDTAALFGGTPAGALPPGASATPIAPAPTGPMAPPPPAAPATAPGVQPAHDFLNPPPPPAPVAPPPPPVRYNHGGQVYTEAQLTAAGWTAAQIEALPKA